MASWFVGQRVRLVRPWLGYLYPDALQDWNRLKGQEGVIIATPSFNEYGDLAVTVSVRSGCVYMPEYGLEPITDIHQPCEADFKESLDLLVLRTEEMLR